MSGDDDGERPQGTDHERSAKNFTPDVRAAVRRDQLRQHLDNARAQLADQAATFARALAIIAEVAPHRLAEFNLTLDDVRHNIAAPPAAAEQPADVAPAPPPAAVSRAVDDTTKTAVTDVAAIAALVEAILDRRDVAKKSKPHFAAGKSPRRDPASRRDRTQKAKRPVGSKTKKAKR